MPAEIPFLGVVSHGKFMPISERAGVTFYPLQQPSIRIEPKAEILPVHFGNLINAAAGLDTTVPKFTSSNLIGPSRDMAAKSADWGRHSDGALVSLQFEKVLGQASGRWTAMFKDTGPINWMKRDVVDGDWADLVILRNGIPIPMARGVVDTVREQTRSSGGATVRAWNVSGRDHGAFFEYPISWASLWVQTLGEVTQGLMTAEVQGKIGGRPDELFALLIKAGVGPGKYGGQWELPPSLSERVGSAKRMYDLLRVVALSGSGAAPSSAGGLSAAASRHLRGAYWNEPRLWNEGGQHLHQTLLAWCNPLLNEIFYDLVPAPQFMPPNGLSGYQITSLEDVAVADLTPVEAAEAKTFGQSDISSTPKTPKTVSLTSDGGGFGVLGAYIRERPFPSTVEGSGSLWFALPTWLVPDWLIESTDLGWGGAERYNLFELTAEFGLGATNEHPPQAKPIWFKDGVKRWGLRAFQQTSAYCAADGDFGKWYPERDIWQRLLVDWYAPSPWLRQGTITFKICLPEIRVGQRLIVATESGGGGEEQFYVEGVRHEWSFPPGKGSTTVTVTHGFRGSDGQYLAAVKAASALFEKTP
jgi:hypothetical protein